ncbi:MAG: zinc-binding alcohol dehydrogenase, partial [Microbacteriaceae bacterium]
IVAVHGLGVVGLFCAQLAARSAGLVIGIDKVESRRRRAKEFGIHAVASPEEAHDLIMELTNGRGVDISFEVSGAPPALQAALDSTAFEGTVVVISWYGEKVVPLVLSPNFHMKRLRMVSSQVNVIGAPLRARWDAKRRMDLVWDLLPTLHPAEMITHRFPFAQAQSAFDIFSDSAADPLAVVLTYPKARP